MFTNLPLTKMAYSLIILGIGLKTYGLYFLANKKTTPFQERRRVYRLFNWPANILLATGVIMLALKWYM